MPKVKNSIEEKKDPHLITFYEKGLKMNNHSSRENLMSDVLYSDLSPLNLN